MNVNVYEGQWGNENLLFSDDDDLTILPRKDDFIFCKCEVYKVMYTMVDIDNKEYTIFVRKSIEEDF